MPRAGKRSSAKEGATLEEVTNLPPQFAAEHRDKMKRIDQLYENWKAGVATQRTMRENVFAEFKENKLKEIDNLKIRLGPSILKMTVGEFLIQTEKPEEVAKVEAKEEPMEMDYISSTVDQALMDLQEIPSAASLSSEKPSARSSKTKKKKAPPKTARKKNKKPPGNPMETPCNSGLAIDWQNTPFYTPQVRSRTGQDHARPASQDEMDNAIAKIAWVTKTGSPLIYAPTNPELRRRFEEKLKEIVALKEEDDSAASGKD